MSEENENDFGGAEITSLGRAIVVLGMRQLRACITRALLESDSEQAATRAEAVSEGLRNGLIGL